MLGFPGSTSRPSRRYARRTAAARSGRSSTGRSPRTRSSRCTRHGGGRSRTSSSATRRCAASTSATRTASTARGSGSRSESSGRSASTRSARSRSTGSSGSPPAAGRWSSTPRSRSRAAASVSASGWTGATTTTPSATRISSTSGGSCRSSTSGAGSTSAIARRRGVRVAAPLLSQHELTQSGVYQEKSDPSLFVRFPLLDHPGESVVVWTTTPWTLPGECRRCRQPGGRVRAARERRMGARGSFPRRACSMRRAPGSELVGLRYQGAFGQPRARRERRASRRPVGRGLAR